MNDSLETREASQTLTQFLPVLYIHKPTYSFSSKHVFQWNAFETFTLQAKFIEFIEVIPTYVHLYTLKMLRCLIHVLVKYGNVLK